MHIKLDKKNLVLLHELDKNARQSNSALAKKLKLSKDAVSYRLRELEKKGVIKGYFTVIDSSKLGYLLYRLFTNLIDIDSQTEAKIVDYLKETKNAWKISNMDGAWNFGFAIWVKSNNEFQNFYHNGFAKQFREHIKDALICPITKYQQWDRNYLTNTPKSKHMEVTGNPKVVDYDETDLAILAEISINPKMPLIQLAKKLKVDSMTIHRRIKAMEKNTIIQGYKADIDLAKIGLDSYSVKISLKNMSEIAKINKYVINLPETQAIIEAIGGFDVEFDLEVKGTDRYYSIIQELKNNFSSIREIKYFRTINYQKSLYLPKF